MRPDLSCELLAIYTIVPELSVNQYNGVQSACYSLSYKENNYFLHDMNDLLFSKLLQMKKTGLSSLSFH